MRGHVDSLSQVLCGLRDTDCWLGLNGPAIRFDQTPRLNTQLQVLIMRTCPHCQQIVSGDPRYCPGCGRPLPQADAAGRPGQIICQQCGQTNARTAKFCGHCGAEIEQLRNGRAQLPPSIPVQPALGKSVPVPVTEVQVVGQNRRSCLPGCLVLMFLLFVVLVIGFVIALLIVLQDETLLERLKEHLN